MIAEWLFTNKCNALVDENGDALEGEALAKAKQNKHAKTCGARVSLGAKFCRKCGAPAPGGWWTCSHCGHKIGNESTKCSYCGADQHIENRRLLQAGVWSPEYGTFAQRFEVNAYRPCLENGLVIQSGQIGILLNGGEIGRELPPGSYSLQSLDSASNVNGQNGGKSVIILQSGEQKFSFVLDEMRTQEGLDIRVTLAIYIAYAPGHHVDFIQNMMGNPALINGNLLSASLTMDAIAHHILFEETELIVRRFCFNTKAEDLMTNPDIPMQLEKVIASAMQKRLEANGFQFKGVGEVNFSGKLFEELQKQAGDVEAQRRSVEYSLQSDRFIKDQEKRMALQNYEQEEYLKELAHKAQIKDEELERDLDRLRETQRMEKELAELDARYKLAHKELVDTNELDRLQDQYDEDRKRIQQSGELERRKAEHDELLRQKRAEMDTLLHNAKINDLIQRMKMATDDLRIEQWIARQERSLRMKKQIEREEMQFKNGMNLQTLIATAEDPAMAGVLLEYQRQTLMAEMTPEQILAMGAAEGKSAAAEAFKAIRSNQEEYNERLAQIQDEYAKALERDERLLTKIAEHLN